MPAGDIITRVNETEIRDPRQLLLTVSQLAPGTKVEIEYLRENRSRQTTATLEERPERYVAGTQRRDDGVLDGVGVADLTSRLRDQLQIPARIEGVVVTQVDPASAAARQGLRQGDVILEIGRERVRNAEQAVRRSEEVEGPRVLVRVWRDGGIRFLVIDESAR